MRKVSLFAVLLVGAAACRTPKPAIPSPPRPAQTIQMDPLRFKVGPDGKIVAEFQDPESLFDQADRLFRQKKLAQALERYDRLLRLHPRSRYRTAALYNAGLALEKLGRPEEAAVRYRTVIEEVPRSRDAIDAHFRLGECLAKLGRWRDVSDLFTRLLLRDDLKPIDNLEARVRKGVAHAELGDDIEAERTLLKAVRYHQDASRLEPLGDPALLAQAYFYLGDVAQRRMSRKSLDVPERELAAALNAKGQLLLVAQARYLKSIRTGHPQWSPAAGHQLGALYERFHREILAAPIPPQLTPTEREIYLEELHKKVRPLISKAVAIYHRNLALAERLGATGAWVEKTRARMEKLRRLVETPSRPVQASGTGVPADAAKTPPASPAPVPPPRPTPEPAGKPRS